MSSEAYTMVGEYPFSARAMKAALHMVSVTPFMRALPQIIRALRMP